jgi:predicted aspartyl protease
MKNSAFTTHYGGLARVLYTTTGICPPLTEEEIKTDGIRPKEYIAIWDTGATNSAITKRVADDLGLQPTGVVEVRHAKGKSFTNTYLVNILLPNNVMVGQVRVTEAELVADDGISLEKQPQILIGMDVISLGDFAVSNFNGKTIFSFHVPSIQEIDFIPKAQERNIAQGGNRHARRALRALKKGL